MGTLWDQIRIHAHTHTLTYARAIAHVFSHHENGQRAHVVLVIYTAAGRFTRFLWWRTRAASG